MTFREEAAARKARGIRRAIARMYKNHPDRAVAYVNGALDEASRAEERRAAFLMRTE